MSTGIIYCAHCLVSGKKYIGQTRQKFEERIRNHKKDSKILNYIFYKAIKKYGWDNFVWGIIEECDQNLLNKRETYWINYYNTYKNGYNSTLIGYGSKNKKVSSFIIVDPNGNIIEGKNKKQFCRENNLNISAFSRLFSGNKLSYKGYKLPETNLFGEEARLESTTINYCFQSPSGDVVEGKNLSKFCEKNNLLYSHMQSVLKGRRLSHKGWTLSETKSIKYEIIEREYALISPEGNIYSGKNISKLCKKHNLDPSSISKVLLGKRKSHKGWKLYT